MYIHGEHTRKWFHCTLNTCGNRICQPNRLWFSKISCYKPLGPYCFGFCKKNKKKLSCMCTFKRQDRIVNGRVRKGYPKPAKLETGFGKKDKVLNHQWWHLFVVSICYFFESSRFQIENCSTNHPPLMFSLSCSPYKCRRRGQKGAAFFCWDKFAIAFLLRILQLLAESRTQPS